MVIRVMEMGTRPIILTPARRDAPQAARIAGELLGQQRFADFAAVVLDWSDELGQQPDGSKKKAVLYMQVQKHFPNGQHVTVEHRLDVDDVFASGVISNEVIRDLIKGLEEKVAEATARWKESHN